MRDFESRDFSAQLPDVSMSRGGGAGIRGALRTRAWEQYAVQLDTQSYKRTKHLTKCPVSHARE